MRRTVIAGNWKMNMTPSETKKFITELAPMVAGLDKCDIVLCVPAIDIAAAVEAAKGTNIKIGAENVHFKESGAYTGEISAKMLHVTTASVTRCFWVVNAVHIPSLIWISIMKRPL